jgi:hypothetical protein
VAAQGGATSWTTAANTAAMLHNLLNPLSQEVDGEGFIHLFPPFDL